MAIGTADQLTIGYWKETAWGTPPAGTTSVQLLRVTGESFNTGIQYAESVELTGDRNIKELDKVDADGTGDINFQLTYGSFEDFMEGALAAAFSANILKNGAVIKSFDIEKKIVDIATPVFISWQGAVIESMKLDLKPGAFVTGSFSFMSKPGATSLTSMSSVAATAVDANPIFSSVSDITAFNEGGSGITQVQGLTIETKNNYRMIKSIGVLGPSQVALGQFRCTGTLDAYFQDKSLLDKFLQATATSISIQIGLGANKKYVILLPAVQYTDAEVVAGGINTDIVAKLKWIALKDTVTELAAIKITRTP